MSFLLLQKEPSLCFPTFGCLPRRQGGEGRVGRVVFFLCFPLSRTPPPPPMRPLLAMPCAFSETVINKLLNLRSSHSAFLNPPVLVPARAAETLAVFCSVLAPLWIRGPEPPWVLTPHSDLLPPTLLCE